MQEIHTHIYTKLPSCVDDVLLIHTQGIFGVSYAPLHVHFEFHRSLCTSCEQALLHFPNKRWGRVLYTTRQTHKLLPSQIMYLCIVILKQKDAHESHGSFEHPHKFPLLPNCRTAPSSSEYFKLVSRSILPETSIEWRYIHLNFIKFTSVFVKGQASTLS